MVKTHFRVLAASAVMFALANVASAQVQGPSTSQTPYVVPVAPGVITKSIISNGNGTTTPNEVYDKIGGGSYRLVGLPDGLGAFDNGDGTFTLLASHEAGATAGITRDHGSIGSFVSKWVINKSDLSVVGGADLIQNVRLWNTATDSFVDQTSAFDRFCSSDLAEQSAYYNASTGMGTQIRLYTTGEEASTAFGSRYGRGFAVEVDGSNAGRATELAELGDIAFENIVASPFAQDKTVVMGLDDASRQFNSEISGGFVGNNEGPSQLYTYVGTKTNTGDAVQRAGLTNGTLYGIKVADRINEDQIVNGDAFSLFNMNSAIDVSEDVNGVALENASIANQITEFRRVEDGVWDPNNANVFYFVTTDRLTPAGGRSQIWQLTYNDITDPTLGGTISALTDGTEGYEMFDNMTAVDVGNGMTRLLLQEDLGNTARSGKTWIYDVAGDDFLELAKFDVARFGDGNPVSANLGTGILATAPFNRDEEASGIIPADFLGKGWFLASAQAHYSITGELVQGGQLFAMYVPQAVPEPSSIALLGLGAIGLVIAARRNRKS